MRTSPQEWIESPAAAPARRTSIGAIASERRNLSICPVGDNLRLAREQRQVYPFVLVPPWPWPDVHALNCSHSSVIPVSTGLQDPSCWRQ